MTSFRLSGRSTLVAGAAVSVLLLAGCGGQPEPAPSPDVSSGPAPEVTDINAAIFRTVGGAAVYAAEADGFAEAQGITLTHEFIESSQAAVSLLIGGGAQVAFSNYMGVINANREGIPLVVVAEGLSSTDDFITLEALPDSGIESLEDLEGKTVGVTSLNSALDGKIKDAMTEEGLDPSSVDFVALAFGEMGAALETGSLDAASFTGPAQVDARSRLGTVEVFDYGTGAYDGFAESGFVMTREFVEANPNSVRAFQCALKEGAEAVAADEDKLIALSAENMEAEEDSLRGVPLPGFEPEIRMDKLQQNADLMELLGLLDEPFDMSTVVIPTPTDC